jgi:predicted acetyltransferase
MILDHAESRPFDSFDRFAQFEESRGKTLDQLLEEFDALRGASVESLEGWNLTEQELGRTGRHPELGRVTLRQHLSTWVAHDLGHIGQIVRVMAKQYGGQVGPWGAYLRILRD